MRVEIHSSKVDGNITPPPSKSYTHRALICSALTRGISVIISPLYSDDTEATRRVLLELGVEIQADSNLWKIEGGELHKSANNLFCGESGTTLRFMAAVCALVDGESRLVCGPSLSNRPIDPLLDGLRQLGVDCESAGGKPPVVVRGNGKIRGGYAAIRGDISSQFVSALLLVSPLADSSVSLELTTNLESRFYVNMTMETQRKFGVEVDTSKDMREFHIQQQSYRPYEFKVERDWSSAAPLLAAGGLAGKVTIEGLKPKSFQADSTIIDILKKMGAQMELHDNTISIQNSSLHGVELDMSDCPDLFPVVAALCSAAEGISTISGIRRLRYKESDRVAAMVEGLRVMGIKAIQRGNEVRIVGGEPLGGYIDPRKDHRIAMAFSLLGLIAKEKTVILDAECVSKSYPRFWDALESLGGDFRRIDNEQ